MKILAFDQATAVTGYAVFKDGEFIKHGKISFKKMTETTERIRAMMLAINDMICQEAPDVVVIEDVAMQKNAGTLILLSRIQGSVLGYCYEHGITIMIIQPTEWRSILGMKQGKNVARPNLKAQAKQFVKDIFGLTVTEDEADAICIGNAVELKYIKGE